MLTYTSTKESPITSLAFRRSCANGEMKEVLDVFEEGDYLLLSSDGLTNKVSHQELLETIEQETTLDEKAESLINKANAYGGEDNITLVLLKYDQAAEGVETS